MKKAILIAAGIALLSIAGYRLYLALLPDEVKIRRSLARIEDAFNEGSAGGIAARLTDDFEEEQSRLGRDEIRLFLFQYFRTQVDHPTHELRFAVEAPPESMEIAIEHGDPPTAAVAVTARFSERRGNERTPVCTVLFRATLAKVDGEWKVRRASHKLVEGRYPF